MMTPCKPRGTDGDKHWPSQAVAAVTSISLAILGIAAVNESRVHLIAVGLLVAAIVTLLRRDFATTQRASDLAAIGRFTASLVGLTRTREVAEFSLRQIAHALGGNRAAIVLASANPALTQTYHVESHDIRESVDYDFLSLLVDLTEPVMITHIERNGHTIIPECVAAPITVNQQRGLVVVWDRPAATGQLLPRDLRTLGSMAAQLNVALERSGVIDQLYYDAHHNPLRALPKRPVRGDGGEPRRLELVDELRTAIGNRSLDVWYQPRIDLEKGTVVGAEALARWNHERYGFVPPDEFIVLAEDAGLMRDLTDAILERTIRDIRRWADRGIELPIAVNLSARNLLDSSLSTRVGALLAKNDIPCERLSFEITETAIMGDRERVAGVLGAFRAQSISLAIDDYGTGYSSLAYLRELPVDELKIDRSFISNVDVDPQNEVIVRSTIDMAHNLGLVVVAEGIEREEEYALLASLGCDFAQGHLMSKALPAEKFEVWLAANGHPAIPPVIASTNTPRPGATKPDRLIDVRPYRLGGWQAGGLGSRLVADNTPVHTCTMPADPYLAARKTA